jgi:putative oxidoreductase
MALYTLGTSLVARRYWIMTGAGKLGAAENVYKNLSIMGGFLLLYVTGARKHSMDGLSNSAS